MVDPVKDLEQAGDAAEADAIGWVERHPVKAVLFAFAAGIVFLGLIELVF